MSKLLFITGEVSAGVTVRVPDDHDPNDPDSAINAEIVQMLSEFIVDNLGTLVPGDPGYEVEEVDDDADTSIDFFDFTEDN